MASKDGTESEGQRTLQILYEGVRKQMGTAPNILQVFSLQSEAMRATMTLFQILMYGPDPFTRAQRVMSARVVSGISRCESCQDNPE